MHTLYRVEPLAKFLPGLKVPLGLTHGIYVSGPGIFESQAVTLCYSEHTARLICALLNARAIVLAAPSRLKLRKTAQV